MIRRPLDFPAPEGIARPAAETPKRRGMRIRPDISLAGREAEPVNPFVISKPAPGVLPAGSYKGGRLAMDWTQDVNQLFQWAMQGAFSEGIGFVGYPYLAQLTQRAEYRRISEIIAKEMTRKWIKVTAKGDSKSAKVDKMNDALVKFNVQDLFRQLAEVDGFMGRAHLFADVGTEDPHELAMPLIIDKRKIERGALKGFRVIEPLWIYPGDYNSTNPLHEDFYRPNNWYVQGRKIHRTRLLTLVMRELPDMLKPAYQFGGLSMSQMAKPYIDNWLRTRQSVSDLLHSFSTMVLATNMADVVEGGAADNLFARAQLFTQTRDNRGLMLTDKESEELTNVSAPLGSLDKLQAQSQEQMASVAGVPLVVLLGVTPSGLNASSDGEIRTFYASIASDQERFFRPKLRTVFDLIQISEFGRIDRDIDFTFVPLWETDEEVDATNRKTQADTDTAYINAGVVDPQEVRERLATDDESPYYGLDLNLEITPPAVQLAEMEPDPDNEDDGEEPSTDAAA